MSTISAGNTLTTGFVQTSDTTGNLAFQTNGTTTALTLTTSQNASFVGSVSSVNTFGFKNRLINGAMMIDQRNAGASTTPSASGYLLDRFAWLGSVGSKLTFGQNLNSAATPAGFTKYLGAQTASAYTPGASEFFSVYQAIEGLNMADLAWGTSSAKTVTLSFQVYSSLTGTFGGSIYNSAGNRCYPFAYTISSANTWTTATITIPGDTTGTWATDNTAGMVVMFGLGAGSTVSGAAGSWGSTLYRSSSGAVQVVATANATWYVTGVQLETGSQATTFDVRDYGREFIMCQRYYEIVNVASNYNAGFSSTYAWCYYPFIVAKRTIPTMTYSGMQYFTGGSTASFTPNTGGVTQTAFYTGSNAFTAFNGIHAGTASASAEL